VEETYLCKVSSAPWTVRARTIATDGPGQTSSVDLERSVQGHLISVIIVRPGLRTRPINLASVNISWRSRNTSPDSTRTLSRSFPMTAATSIAWSAPLTARPSRLRANRSRLLTRIRRSSRQWRLLLPISGLRRAVQLNPRERPRLQRRRLLLLLHGAPRSSARGSRILTPSRRNFLLPRLLGSATEQDVGGSLLTS
jgi:hypothetical protein